MAETKKPTLWRDPFWADKYPEEDFARIQPIINLLPGESEVDDKIAEYREYYRKTFGDNFNVALSHVYELYQWMAEKIAEKAIKTGAILPKRKCTPSNFILVHEADTLDNGKTIYWPRIINVKEVEGVYAGKIVLYDGTSVVVGESSTELADLLNANYVEDWKAEE